MLLGGELLVRFFFIVSWDFGYFQLGGARVHSGAETMNVLQPIFQDRLISLGAEHEFPPRSCDIIPCDFFLWPFIKNPIFHVPINDLDHLQARIIEKVNEINNNPVMLQNVFNSVNGRCRNSVPFALELHCVMALF